MPWSNFFIPNYISPSYMFSMSRRTWRRFSPQPSQQQQSRERRHARSCTNTCHIFHASYSVSRTKNLLASVPVFLPGRRHILRRLGSEWYDKTSHTTAIPCRFKSTTLHHTGCRYTFLELLYDTVAHQLHLRYFRHLISPQAAFSALSGHHLTLLNSSPLGQ